MFHSFYYKGSLHFLSRSPKAASSHPCAVLGSHHQKMLVCVITTLSGHSGRIKVFRIEPGYPSMVRSVLTCTSTPLIIKNLVVPSVDCVGVPTLMYFSTYAFSVFMGPLHNIFTAPLDKATLVGAKMVAPTNNSREHVS